MITESLVKKDRKTWVLVIRDAWQATVDGIFEVGKLLMQAKKEIPHGAFTEMIEEDLPFSARTAQRLIHISMNENLLNPTHVSLLPPNWGALYELARQDDGTFSLLLENEIIHPEMERGDIKKFLRSLEIDEQRKRIKQGEVVSPDGPFDVIVLDPPWPYGTQDQYDPHGLRGSTPYPEMSLEEIASQSVSEKAKDDCILWLWTTHKFMRHSFPLLDVWGFEDKAILTWAKDKMGTGRWLRSQSEFCILSVRGKPPIDLTNQTTVLNAPMREHSRKPDEFFDMVEKYCLGADRVDWFAREGRPGWAVGGNDTERFNDKV